MRLLITLFAVFVLACSGLEALQSSGEEEAAEGSPVDLSVPRETTAIETGLGDRLDVLTGGEIRALMTGNSLVGAYTGSNDVACEHHAREGTITGFYREAYTAQWRVSGDTICYTYTDGPETCQWMVVTSQGLLANYTSPDGALLTTSQVLHGNACR